MVRIKITKAEYPDETGYVGDIYDAFVMKYGCDDVKYTAHVEADKILSVRAENCEIIEEDIPSLKVKIIKAENSWQEPYVGGVYEAFKMKYSDRDDYCVRVAEDNLIGFEPKLIEEITEGALAAVEEQTVEPTKKILLVEDGSVDVDELDAWCDQNGIKLIVYRQGANKPEFLDF